MPFLYLRSMPTAFIIVALRLFGIPFLFTGYVLYQAVVKKKRWSEIKQDALLTFFFIVAYAGLYFLLT
jgi:hypothetical protein